MVRSFTRPIADLTSTVDNIAATGTLRQSRLMHRPDEVGHLSRAFDEMIERLKTSEGRLAQAAAEERSRLARDLHDAVSQTLFSASIIAEVLPRLWEKNPAEARRRLEEVRQLTKGALAEMRTLLFELRPAALADAELSHLMRQLAESITGRARIPVSVEMEGDYNPPTEAKIALYRIAQEALNNVAKHSEATEARISLAARDGRVTLVVSDNGQGFDMESAHPDSLGLNIMRERAAGIGARLAVRSSPGCGTEVSVEWQSGKKPPSSGALPGG